jgi:hypothetical protein
VVDFLTSLVDVLLRANAAEEALAVCSNVFVATTALAAAVGAVAATPPFPAGPLVFKRDLHNMYCGWSMIFAPNCSMGMRSAGKGLSAASPSIAMCRVLSCAHFEMYSCVCEEVVRPAALAPAALEDVEAAEAAWLLLNSARVSSVSEEDFVLVDEGALFAFDSPPVPLLTICTSFEEVSSSNVLLGVWTGSEPSVVVVETCLSGVEGGAGGLWWLLLLL